MNKYVILASIAVLLTAVSQLLLKIAALKTSEKPFIFRYLDWRVFLAYLLFITVTVLNLVAYKYLPIKMNVVFLPVTFILVSILSMFVLQEPLGRKQKWGSFLVIVGVVVYNL